MTLQNTILLLIGWFIVIPPYLFCWQFVRNELDKTENTKMLKLIYAVAAIPGILVLYGLTVSGLIQLNNFI